MSYAFIKRVKRRTNGRVIYESEELYWRQEEALAGKMLQAFQNMAATFEVDIV